MEHCSTFGAYAVKAGLGKIAGSFITVTKRRWERKDERMELLTHAFVKHVNDV
jgi:hypothetical protein